MRRRLPLSGLAAGLAVVLAGPAGLEPPTKARGQQPPPSPSTQAKPPGEPCELDAGAYPWLAEMDVAPDELEPLCARWSPPAGYQRVDVTPNGFGAWLRGLPLRTDCRAVHAYDGRTVRAASAGVVALDLLPGNVQQCADTILRLHAEHAWHRGRASELAYHFTSGDAVAWRDWARGERYRIDGARVRRVRGAPRERTRDAFRAWQRRVFAYAGTRSLPLDSEPVPASARLEPGDLFVAPGGPGHAVILLDVAEGPGGERAALVGQGFMPAQELHVLRPDPADGPGGPWFRLPEAGGSLETPSWRPFARESARRLEAHVPRTRE